MNLRDMLESKRNDILRIAERHGASDVCIFGSVARGEADDRSDIDLLVELDPGRSLLDHAALVVELEDLLGRRVDVVTVRGLKERVRHRVLEEAVPL